MPKLITSEDRLLREKNFIELSKSIHGDRFDYSRVYYVNNHTKVCILYNGKELWQKPSNHIMFKGTQGKDAMERSSSKKMTKENWEVHKKAVKRKKNKRYYKRKKTPEWYMDPKRRKFKKIRTFKCIECGKKFKRKERFFGYKGLFCGKACVGKHYKTLFHKSIRDEVLKYKFMIVTTECRKKKELIDKFIEKKDALEKFQELINGNENVILPQQYAIVDGECVEIDYEYLLIERSEDESLAFTDRDELGRVVDLKVKTKNKNDKFIIINKTQCRVEQMFNIRGYDKEVDVNHIINNILIIDEEPKNIMVYHNDMIVKTENNIEMILSQHQYIIFDLYNFLQTYCQKNKIKHINFMGIIDDSQILEEYYDKLITEKYGV